MLREFIERIEVSHAERWAKTREITIVYNFVGVFDFNRAIEEARNTTQKKQRTAYPFSYTVLCVIAFLIQRPFMVRAFLM